MIGKQHKDALKQRWFAGAHEPGQSDHLGRMRTPRLVSTSVRLATGLPRPTRGNRPVTASWAKAQRDRSAVKQGDLPDGAPR